MTHNPDPKDLTWNLQPLFSGDNDPNLEEQMEEVRKANEGFIAKWKGRTDYLSDVSILRQALDELELLERRYGQDGNVGYYFSLRLAQEQDNSDLKAKYNKLHDQVVRLHNEIQFFWLSLAKIPLSDQERFLKAEELSPYRYWLEQLFVFGKYMLSDAEERIMTMKGKVSSGNWVHFVSETLSTQGRETLLPSGEHKMQTLEELLTLIADSKSEVRRSAAEALEDIFEKNLHIVEAEMNSILEDKKVNDEIRGYARPDLGRHLSDGIDTEVVDALVEVVSKRNEIAQRFYRLKAKYLGLDKLNYYERGVSVGEVDMKFSYSEAIDLIQKVFNNLDPQFGQILESFVDNGQLDVFPRASKTGGAFCTKHTQDTPVYVLLNFTGKLRDVTTIAHEMGHAINDELMKVQNAMNFDTSLATAEVASTFMEDFVLEELLRTATPEQAYSIKMAQLDDVMASVFRQVAFYRFETDLHKAFREKGYLPAEDIGKLFRSHMDSYFGDASGAENWWTYVSHFRNFFYVYSYASGLLISKSLQRMVREDRSKIAAVKGFLSAGTSSSPKQIFAQLGIDIMNLEFWIQGLDEIEQMLSDLEKGI